MLLIFQNYEKMLSILKHHFFQYPDDKLVMTQKTKNGNALEDYQDLFEKAITKNARIIFYLFFQSTSKNQ